MLPETLLIFLLSAILGNTNPIPRDFEKLLPISLRDETNMTAPEIIAKYHYPIETHHVTTQDGYILTLHRIPYKSKKRNNYGSVLVMHGILESSTDWIITGPGKGLGYVLSDAGYDVWLANARGNRYSKNHTILDTNSEKFWDFSWHEIAVFDLPATIDHILEETGETQIFYVGHSQGTTIFYVMCAMLPTYNQKIRAQFSLAPVAFVSHLFSPFMQMLAKTEFFLEKLIGAEEFMPRDGFVNKLARKFCPLNGFSAFLCKNTLFAITGFNSKQLNATILPLILAHLPAGSSSKQFLHFAQEINSGEFRQFDYGFWGNRQRYRAWSPPSYNLSQITASLYFFYSENDWISSAQDVFKLARNLKSVKGKFRVSDERFDHLDYVFGIDAPKLVYSKILSLMTRH